MNKKQKPKTINPLSLIIRSDIWEAFKLLTPREKSLNDAVVDLIKNYIDNKEWFRWNVMVF